MKNSNITIDDIFKNLFTEKYCISIVIDVLAKCKTNGTLNDLIKKFYPQYFNEEKNEVLEIALCKDLQLL